MGVPTANTAGTARSSNGGDGSAIASRRRGVRPTPTPRPPAVTAMSRSTNSRNFTDLATIGTRLEATRLVSRNTITYGADVFRDHSDNTDSSVTTVLGFGPPRPQTSNRAQVPNASFRSAGVFAQDEVALGG